MDGYTFMIERNRRLIQHEAGAREARTRIWPEAEGAEAELRRDILGLYRSLEGCGRGKAGEKGEP